MIRYQTTSSRWFAWFVVNSSSFFAPDPLQRNLINDIIKDKEEIGMAAALLQEISQDEHERARLRSRRMYETDRISDLLTAEEKGMMKVISLLEKGIPLEEVKKILGTEKS